MTMRILAAILLLVSLSGCSGPSTSTALGFGVVDLTGNSAVPENTPTTSPTLQSTDLEADIEIEDQRGDGTVVAVEEVSVQRGNAFLVITTMAGDLLASDLVSPRSQPVNVVFSKPIANSAQLQAALYLDDGDGKFDPMLDFPIFEEDGEQVRENFFYEVVR